MRRPFEHVGQVHTFGIRAPATTIALKAAADNRGDKTVAIPPSEA
jgi:hypothetical protein